MVFCCVVCVWGVVESMMYVLHELVFIRSAVTADSVKQNIVSSRHNPPVVLSLEPPGDQCSSECI